MCAKNVKAENKVKLFIVIFFKFKNKLSINQEKFKGKTLKKKRSKIGNFYNNLYYQTKNTGNVH